uniref:Uncharacterized protein n=1 Tax=Ditylenchus dipsaci TaxID=166011 RepID=A0A915EQG4_9BILA
MYDQLLLDGSVDVMDGYEQTSGSDYEGINRRRKQMKRSKSTASGSPLMQPSLTVDGKIIVDPRFVYIRYVDFVTSLPYDEYGQLSVIL